MLVLRELRELRDGDRFLVPGSGRIGFVVESNERSQSVTVDLKPLEAHEEERRVSLRDTLLVQPFPLPAEVH